jgi:hypothetical protein
VLCSVEPEDPELSCKILVFLHILNYCRIIGDKVVIFSQSLHTLGKEKKKLLSFIIIIIIIIP